MKRTLINILIIEHNLIHRRLFSYLLQDMGFDKTTETANSTVGWDLIKKYAFDIIFCDFSMPEMNGIDLLKRVRCDAVCKKIPFFIITASNKKNIIIKAIDSGVTEFILKPFDADFIEKKIHQVLNFEAPYEMTHAC